MKVIDREEMRLKILSSLHEHRIMISDIIISDSVPTARVNLLTKVVEIGYKFLVENVRNINDIVFLLKHEVFHRFISNQWNKQRLVDTIISYRPNSDVPNEIDWSILNAVEDSFINAYIRNAGKCVSDFPEYFYTKESDVTRWLCNTWDFDVPKWKKKESVEAEEYRNKQKEKQEVLYNIRYNKDFFISLYTIANAYWIIWQEKKEEGDGDGDSEDGEGNGESGGASEGEGNGESAVDDSEAFPIESIDDPTPGGEELESGTSDQEKVVEEQCEQEASAGETAGRSAGLLRKIFVPNINKDMKLAKVFNVYTTEMEELANTVENKKTLVDFLEGRIQRSRSMGSGKYNSVRMPKRFSRHDLLTMTAFKRTPTYYQHKQEEVGEKDAKWNFYLDVSGSMDREIPMGRFIANKLEKLANKMYCFSDSGKPTEYDGGSYIWTSGGTCMRECFDHCASAGIKHMMLIGDAADYSYTADHLTPRTLKWAKQADTIMLVVNERPSSGYIQRAQEIFKYVYVLKTDTMYKGIGR